MALIFNGFTPNFYLQAEAIYDEVIRRIQVISDLGLGLTAFLGGNVTNDPKRYFF